LMKGLLQDGFRVPLWVLPWAGEDTRLYVSSGISGRVRAPAPRKRW